MHQDPSPDSHPSASPTVSSQVLVRAKSRAHFAWRLLTYVVIVLLVMLMALAWIVGTHTGSRFLLQSVQTLSAQQLSFVGIEGRLLDHLQIDEVHFRSQTQQLDLSGVELDWKPLALFGNRLSVNSLKISAVRSASAPDNQALAMPSSLLLPLALEVKQFAIGRLTIAQFVDDKSLDKNALKNAETKQQVNLMLSAITGSADSDRKQHQLKLSLQSEWGTFVANAQLQGTAPYALKADFTYTGQARTNLPAISLRGNLSGDLQTLRLQAHSITPDSQVAATNKSVTAPLSAVLDLSLSPFASMPLRGAKVQVDHLNPQWLNASAPYAMLSMHVDVQAPNSADTVRSTLTPKPDLATSPPPATPVVKPVATKSSAQTLHLQGRIELKNSAPQTLDRDGIPVRAINTQIQLHDKQVQLTNTLLALSSGRLEGGLQLNLGGDGVPQLDGKFLLSDIDLMQIDSRLRTTRIKGKLELQSKSNRRLDFQAQLNDPRASLNADANFVWNQRGESGKLSLKKFELLADQSRFSGSAEVDFEATQAFKMQAKLEQFNPAHWGNLPVGRIDAEMTASGNLSPMLQMQLQLPSLSGELAGQKLNGVADLSWKQAGQQNAALKLDQLRLGWGANEFTAQGKLGAENDVVQMHLQAENLALFETVTGFAMGGKANLKLDLKGKLNALIAKGTLAAEQLKLPGGVQIGQLNSDFTLGTAANAAIDVKLSAMQIVSEIQAQTTKAKSAQVVPKSQRQDWLEQLNVQVQGQRESHQISVAARLTPTRRLALQASGGLDLKRLDAPIWRGQLAQFQAYGLTKLTDKFASKAALNPELDHSTADLSLLAAMPLELSRERVSLGAAKFAGGLGQLAIQSLEWTPQSLVSKGSFDAVPVIALVQLLHPQERFGGDLKLGVQWDVQLKDHLRATLNLQRQQGDLFVFDGDGTGQRMPLGLSDLQLSINSAGLLAGSDAERVRVQLQSTGSRLGTWRAKLETQIRKVGDKWTLSSDAPLQGQLQASVPELQWLASQFSAEFSLKGALNADATFSGSVEKPLYKATIEGKGLEFAFASEGLLFPNGELKAELSEETLKLTQLRFSNKIAFVPKQEQFQDLKWLGNQGEFKASGEINWRTQKGAIEANWQAFPLLQRKDRWLVVSGQANMTQVDNVWALVGKLKADAAYFKLPKMPPPSLSGDVLVSRGIKLEDEEQSKLEKEAAKTGLRTKFDLHIDMGPRFVFVGRGLNTALSGTLRLRGTDSSPVHASGSITTNGGQYEGYGQQLEIERGILNFQGSPGNPSLNIRALRKGLAVEAGVDVTGTVANPVVRLVSEPNVPDSEKISWLVLGRDADQAGSADASLLLSAAGAIFGGDGSRNIPKELVQGLGFDEFSIGPSENGGASKLPSQTVAGGTEVGASSNDRVVRIGRRLRPGLVLSVERGVSDASGALKLSWQLTRRIRMIGSFGTDNSVDMKYKFSFN